MIPALLQELMTFAIEKAVKITASSIGYLANVNDDETLLTMFARSTEAMKRSDITERRRVDRPVPETPGLIECIRSSARPL
ncbi:GAF domain-containing protein [Methanosphaerula palustris]|uniref:Putative PAS/PAC sensor protein n=1 Tax=Methanosphaerula palustris (strain ATCC BAA-1556 / DSM 19958 / E1-9c) TaxID=521011 RepID=B8GJ58_METPE|nr:GAF domain-containing protein [Methanosphaerula palustris]ACL15631.1 putative PAS/PAC sensor protein [Methanosphaerula palustris E1-9c]